MKAIKLSVSGDCRRCCVSVLQHVHLCDSLSLCQRLRLPLHKRTGEARPRTSHLLLDGIFLHVIFHQQRFAENSHNNLAHEGSNSLSSLLTHNNLIIFLLTPHPCVVRVLWQEVLIQEEHRHAQQKVTTLGSTWCRPQERNLKMS